MEISQFSRWKNKQTKKVNKNINLYCKQNFYLTEYIESYTQRLHITKSFQETYEENWHLLRKEQISVSFQEWNQNYMFSDCDGIKFSINTT